MSCDEQNPSELFNSLKKNNDPIHCFVTSQTATPWLRGGSSPSNKTVPVRIESSNAFNMVFSWFFSCAISPRPTFPVKIVKVGNNSVQWMDPPFLGFCKFTCTLKPTGAKWSLSQRDSEKDLFLGFEVMVYTCFQQGTCCPEVWLLTRYELLGP